MPRRATIADVAREAGVSRTTVSHALNDKGYVDALTRERVKAVARELGYRPNVRAQRLRTGEARTIALISSMPFEVAGGASRLGFLMEVAAVAASAALVRGLALVLVPPMSTARLPLEQLDIDGAIVIEPTQDDVNVALLQSRGLPIVCIGRAPGDDAVPYIDLHTPATTQLLLAHLLAQGARHIALMIGAQQRNSYIDAHATYLTFCSAHGIDPAVVHVDEAGGEQAAYDACLRLLAQHPELDAICVPVDAFAIGAVRAIGERGLRIPQDMKIVTRYDGVRARSCRPPLTAVDLHLDDVSSLAVDLLFAHLGGKAEQLAVEPPVPQLVVRESSVLNAKTE
ncbi:LacI family DNA-binding transcriptional regulator [Trinickia dinghuensis]|uniref:LacI family DNA-binding transcriptional regulator n=1 Tax=Trinickia dinghuensis TaxID=2291023 RepID=A0A3D8JW69_9BURK|nr:LacI family DNA-binding transcriptional regulator [Trinickia dinghuensis]RDU96856.1 LacI family DNA-binding transcriptional regulator [Trinickia dinghuensis]